MKSAKPLIDAAVYSEVLSLLLVLKVEVQNPDNQSLVPREKSGDVKDILNDILL